MVKEEAGSCLELVDHLGPASTLIVHLKLDGSDSSLRFLRGLSWSCMVQVGPGSWIELVDYLGPTINQSDHLKLGLFDIFCRLLKV